MPKCDDCGKNDKSVEQYKQFQCGGIHCAETRPHAQCTPGLYENIEHLQLWGILFPNQIEIQFNSKKSKRVALLENAGIVHPQEFCSLHRSNINVPADLMPASWFAIGPSHQAAAP